jgi:hypothetical protein
VIEQSESIAGLAAALSKAQGAIEGAVKGKINPAFKSKYADLSSVWEACREHLSANGLSIIQSPGHLADGRMEMTTMLVHASGEWIRGSLTIPLGKVDAQAYGSATTYARRYALAAFVGVAPDDDDGNAATEARPEQQRITPEQHGPDWWGAEGPGVSAYAAKKDGGDLRFEEWRAEIGALTSGAEWRAWCADHAEAICKLPKAWRIILRQEAEDMARELGVDLNQRKAA